MKQFLITVAGVLVGLFVFLIITPFILIGMVGALASNAKGPPAPSNMVLALDLRQDMTDQTPPNPFAAFGSPPSLLDTIGKIHAAESDNRVKGIYVRAATAGMSPAQAEEIRAALQEFQKSGKFVIAHMQNDGVRTSMAGYVAIADADQVWLQEASEFMPMGLATEVTFFGRTLQRYHAQAQFVTREGYKSAPNQLTQTTFTPEHREEMTSLLQSFYDTMIGEIATDRGLEPAAVRSLIENTPYTAADAKAKGLVDELGRPEDAAQAAVDRGEGADLVDLTEYTPNAHGGGGDIIAVVQGEGDIVSGPDEQSVFGGDAAMNSDTVSKALLDAANDTDVRAIIFRVSSPGGSVVASDQILAALRVAQEHGKKVVVSMGDMAASGGYYVSSYADEIVANPMTITGSIGVFGGKMIIGPAMDYYLSTNTETLAMGSPLVNTFTSERPFNQAERAFVDGFIGRAYEQFLHNVAEGRHMTRDQAREIAQGRVWTGAQAMERHLVDHLGGFDVAVARARALAGLDDKARVQLRFYPQAKNPFEELQRLFGVSSESAQALARINAALSDPRVARALAAVEEEDANARAESARIAVQ